MSPLEALRREVAIELDALERRLGPKAVPTAVTVRVKLDRVTGMPVFVECTEERARKVLGAGSAIA